MSSERIDWSRLRSLTTRQLGNALIRDGFVLLRRFGAHKHFRHPVSRRVTVFYHGSGDTFTIKTLKSMIELQARWTEDDLTRLGLLR